LQGRIATVPGASEGKIRKRRRGAFDFLDAACVLGARVEGGVEGRVTQQALNGVERHLAPTHGEGRTESPNAAAWTSEVGAGARRKAVAGQVAAVVQMLVLRGGRCRHDHGREQYDLARRSV
jgi:hypothetical protein